MNKEALWKIYITKNPHWVTGNVTLTPDGLRKLFEQTFDTAHKQGVENGKAIANRAKSSKPKTAGDVVSDLFSGR